MTRLPPDSFLPSGALDNDPRLAFNALNGINGDLSSNVISPLSLSRIASQQGYFDNNPTSALPPANNYVYSPLSSGAVRTSQHPQSFLSPHLQPAAASYDHRSSSLSPTRRGKVGSRTMSAVASPSRNPTLGIPAAMAGSTSHPRSVSADAASAPSVAQVIRRLAQQNGRIREAWEAERKYMEANRERVEEVYKEERAIMEEERVGWESEKEDLLEELRLLKEQVLAFQNDRNKLHGALQRLELEKAGKVAGIVVPLTGLRASGADGSTSDSSFSGSSSHARDQRNGIPNGMRRHDGYSSFQPGSDGVSPAQMRSHFISPASSRISPSQQPESSPFIPFIPNMHLASTSSAPSVADFFGSQLGSPKDEIPVPIVDIQTIHPELEGIPLKAPTIQRSTFTDSEPSSSNSKTSSRNTSPPSDPGKLKRGNSKEQTLRLFAVDESDRLVMHAGHTPSHSLSFFPTAASTEVATVVGDSGGSTPTLGHADLAHPDTNGSKGKGIDYDVHAEAADFEEDGHPEQTNLDLTDDVELKGPLMVRNIPAHDEIFFRRLSDKLEEVSRGEDAVPTCLKDAVDDNVAGSSNVKENVPAAKEGADDAIDSSSTTDKDDAPTTKPKGDENDIPLKLKKSNNFGAPFGAMS